MKLRNILIWAAGLFAVIAFCLMFATTLNATIKTGGVEHSVKLLGNVLGSSKMSTDGVKTDLPAKYAVCALSLTGYILVLVAGLAAVIAPLAIKNKSTQRLILGVAALMLIVGAIFVLVQKGSFVSSETSRRIAEAGVTEEADKKLIHDMVVTEFKDFKMGAAGIIAGIMGILSGLGLVAVQFVREE